MGRIITLEQERRAGRADAWKKRMEYGRRMYRKVLAMQGIPYEDIDIQWHAGEEGFYHETLPTFINLDVGAVTLAATAKAAYPAAAFGPWRAGFFNKFSGRKLWIHAFGRMTTVLTPGNGTWDIYFGTGADATGTVIQSSTAVALQASRTNDVWALDLWVHSRTLGATGTLFCTGIWVPSVTLVLSTAQPVLIPATAPAASGAVDLTGASIISAQFKRSGSTVETLQVHELAVMPLN